MKVVFQTTVNPLRQKNPRNKQSWQSLASAVRSPTSVFFGKRTHIKIGVG
ncbi:hypothetical protein [Geminocystis herdmanii]|nr:hypothetical protein [Geminocystis herdmanii]